MKIIVDVMGGDYSPNEIVIGALNVLKQREDLTIIFYGDKNQIENVISEQEQVPNRYEIVHTSSVISCCDAPVEAIRTKTDSSIVCALSRLKEDSEIQGLVSAGSTGAVLTGAVLKVGRIKGVKRPALAPLFPTFSGGEVMVLDAGALMDADEHNLVQFALMGNAFMKSVKKIDNPRIALLNVGMEEEKGNALTKKAHAMLKELDINFVGNCEARELLSGEYDVIVCDGFAGNVLTKGVEGAVGYLMKMIKQSVTKNAFRKAGALMLKGAFDDVKTKMDVSKIGGAPLLGTSKIVLKAHGNSKAKNIESAVKQVVEFIEADLVDKIQACMEEGK